MLCSRALPHALPYIGTHTRNDTVGAFYKTKRAALFPFVIITPSVLFFSFPWTFPPFHRDTDENLMRPGTVGAPPGDLRVEYFNCTFTPSVCLQRRDCSRIRRTASHKLNVLHTAQPCIYHPLARLRHLNIVQHPSRGCLDVKRRSPFDTVANQLLLMQY